MNATTKSCGSCTLCCKLMDVEEIAKPPERWCVHADKARGCRIYDDRPQSCRDFDCLWLVDPNLEPAFRPDKVRTVLRGYEAADGRRAIVAVCDRATPLAWRSALMLGKLRAAALHGLEVYAMAGSRAWRILPDREEESDAVPVPLRHRTRAA